MSQTVNQNIFNRLFYFCPVLIAFLMPFGNTLTSPVIALWFLVSLFNFKALFSKQNLPDFWFWSVLGFFFLTVISSVLFFNINDPFNAIEIKLSFLFFPLLFFLYRINTDIIKRIIAGFISGNLFASMFCILRAVYYFIVQGDSSYFYYTAFSYFMHSAYFAMYLNLAIVFIVVFYFNWFKSNRNYRFFSYFLILLFITTVILCSSKMGLICLFILIPLFLIYEYRKLIKTKVLIISVAVFVLLLILLPKFFPDTFNRLRSVSVVTQSNIDKSSVESSAVRVLIWEQCIHLIKENFWFGVGVSNANDQLYKAYEENGLTGALSKKFNAHNQYFQSFLGLGIIGFLNLLIITLGLLIKAIREDNSILMFFGLMISVNFLVESMLQTSAGNVFYVFFLCLLLTVNKKTLLNETV